MIRIAWAIAALTLAAPSLAQGTGEIRPVDGLYVMGIQHLALTVGDIDETIAFYAKAVPVSVVRRYRVPGSQFPKALLSRRYKSVDIAVLAFPTGFVQLMDFEPGKAAAPVKRAVIGPGYNHFNFQSSSRDPAILRFKAAGLEVVSRFGKADGVDIGGYGVRYAYGRDINGIMIENESLDAPKRSEPVWLTHVANAAHDRDRMLAFYTTVVGRKPHRVVEQANRPRLDDVAGIDGVSIRGGWINVGNMDLEVWEYVLPRTPAPIGDRKLDEVGISSVAFEVADVKAQAARLKAADVRLAGNPCNVGGWQTQYGYDPEGNIFAFVQRGKAPAQESVKVLR
ncbi:MAG: hypothetical protein HC788_03055 [Sphingopyxis sp.]|nr:hypothetical protein [Sphingopyxis sp.]